MPRSFSSDLTKILEDQTLSKVEKIAQLREIETEARDVQRAASESGMAADDGLNDRLREVELALEQIGAASRKTGAATL